MKFSLSHASHLATDVKIQTSTTHGPWSLLGFQEMVANTQYLVSAGRLLKVIRRPTISFILLKCQDIN